MAANIGRVGPMQIVWKDGSITWNSQPGCRAVYGPEDSRLSRSSEKSYHSPRRNYSMSNTTETEFEYAANDKHYRGLILKFAASNPRAAVVLLPDWRGQSPLARDHANYLVALGCAAVIADLYGDGFSPDSPDQV